MLEVERAVRTATDPNRSVGERLKLVEKRRHPEKVRARLQRARCPCRRKLYQPANLIAIRAVSKLPAEVKAVTRVVDAEADELCQSPKDLGVRGLGLVPDPNPGVVRGVPHVRVRVPVPSRDPLARGLVPVQNQGARHDPRVRRGRGRGRGRDQLRRKVNRVRDRSPGQDQARERVVRVRPADLEKVDPNRDQDQAPGRVTRNRDPVADRGKAKRMQGPDQDLGINRGRGRAVDRGKADRSRDRGQDLRLARDPGPDLPAVLGRRRRGQDQDQGPDRGAARSRTSVNQEARVVRNLSPSPDHVRGQDQRAVLEVGAPVNRRGRPLPNPGNQSQVAKSGPGIRARTGAVGAIANKFNIRKYSPKCFTPITVRLRFVNVEFTYETDTNFAILSFKAQSVVQTETDRTITLI